jgi:hypothetical protein
MVEWSADAPDRVLWLVWRFLPQALTPSPYGRRVPLLLTACFVAELMFGIGRQLTERFVPGMIIGVRYSCEGLSICGLL